MKNQINNETISTNVFLSQLREGALSGRAAEFVIRVTKNNLFLLIRSQEGELLA